jgi:hypothetical protein
MAKKQKDDQAGEGVLAEAAKVVGKAAGKVAAALGAKSEGAAQAPPAPATPKKPKVPKLAPKNKSRLPRKVKKKQQKQTARQS